MMRFLTKKAFYQLGACDPKIFDLLVKDYCNYDESKVLIKVKDYSRKTNWNYLYIIQVILPIYILLIQNLIIILYIVNLLI